MLGWALFAFDSLPAGLAYIRSLFGGFGQALWDGQSLYLLYTNLLTFLLLIIGSTSLPKRLADWAEKRFVSRPVVLSAMETVLVTAGLLLTVAFLEDASYNPFLYFRV